MSVSLNQIKNDNFIRQLIADLFSSDCVWLHGTEKREIAIYDHLQQGKFVEQKHLCLTGVVSK